MENSCATFHANLRCEKENLAHERNPEKYSLEALGILKKGTDMKDKNFIYKINNSHFNCDPDYLFKSSCSVAHIEINLDHEGPENPFTD